QRVPRRRGLHARTGSRRRVAPALRLTPVLEFREQVERALQALEQDRPADAEKGFRAALDANPRDDQLLHLLGVALVRQQRAEEALEPLRKAISLSRRRAEYHNALGCALRDAGQYAEALESFARA